MTISGCISVAANGIILFFFMVEWYSIVHMYHIFLIHSPFFFLIESMLYNVSIPCSYAGIAPFIVNIATRVVHLLQLMNHSPFDRHLGCFHVVTIVNSASMNTGMWIFLSYSFVRIYVQEQDCWIIW